MQFFVRTIEALFYPVGLVWLGLTFAAILFFKRKRRRSAIGCAMLSAFMYIAGATPGPEFLMARLEKPFADANVANAQAADVVIVLGGNVNPSSHDTFGFSLSSSADRIITGVELLRQKKVGAIILGGAPGRKPEPDLSEGKRVEKFLKTWNVAPGTIVGLPGCRNTHEESLRAREVMAEHRWTNAILVTSAFHMPRALATFQKQGINVRPVACDFEGLPVVEGEFPGLRLVPNIDQFKTLTLYLHEVIGWYYYAMRGWI